MLCGGKCLLTREYHHQAGSVCDTLYVSVKHWLQEIVIHSEQTLDTCQCVGSVQLLRYKSITVLHLVLQKLRQRLYVLGFVLATKDMQLIFENVGFRWLMSLCMFEGLVLNQVTNVT